LEQKHILSQGFVTFIQLYETIINHLSPETQFTEDLIKTQYHVTHRHFNSLVILFFAGQNPFGFPLPFFANNVNRLASGSHLGSDVAEQCRNGCQNKTFGKKNLGRTKSSPEMIPFKTFLFFCPLLV
jgi:hypothetical protein